ncbi:MULTISPECIES: ATP-binding protein [unclassified Methylobacterium]|uniref:ATP-binding protein n=1 Tax=unclassified Methylobacterium TaxID=2615210 RepID=UPI0011C1DA31|nr:MULTISPECIES: ATP-binding protein [unclassified Methylobacterium]QEE41120.1 anti-sigma regulatory factor [Methylobacterium sp. WL1]TXM98307.1 anti-sigma regulatory factor [Methylobacterium sp. WL64]TXN52594.1 anti-sigma regulatory factor [Methylobacterium sp. WL2]
MSPEPDVVTVRVTSEIDAAEARQEARRLALRHGFTTVRAHGLATAVSELAMNLVLHTDRGGLIRLTAQDATGAAVIELVAEDDGPGIRDLTLAMEDGYSTRGGLGCGLPGTRRLVDAFAITSHVGEGTRIVCLVRRP